MKTLEQKKILMEDGAGIALWDTGGRKTPLIFVHGFPEDHHCWSPLIQALPAATKTHFRIICYDMRGFGKSSKSGEASLSQFYRDHQSIVSQLKLPRYHLIGHDWGGALTLHVARFHPESLRSMTIMNTNYWKMDILKMWHLLLMNLPLIPHLIFRLCPERLFQLGVCGSFVDASRLSPRNAARYLKMFYDRQATDFWIRLYRQAARQVFSFRKNPAKLMISQRSFQVPTLMVWGKEDHFIPLWVGKDIAARLKKKGVSLEWHLIPDAGHFVQEEQPKLVATILSRYFNMSRPKKRAKSFDKRVSRKTSRGRNKMKS